MGLGSVTCDGGEVCTTSTQQSRLVVHTAVDCSQQVAISVPRSPITEHISKLLDTVKFPLSCQLTHPSR